MFEGLLDRWPKRWDLWNVLLDCEIKGGDGVQVRRLLERITAQKLKSKKAKFFFKRWLEYEDKNGDAKGQERVKALAAEYVRKLTGKEVA